MAELRIKDNSWDLCARFGSVYAQCMLGDIPVQMPLILDPNTIQLYFE